MLFNFSPVGQQLDFVGISTEENGNAALYASQLASNTVIFCFCQLPNNRIYSVVYSCLNADTAEINIQVCGGVIKYFVKIS